MASRRLLGSVVALLLSYPLSAQELAQDFNALDMQTGQQVRLSDYRGRVVFLDFWASWCPPCLVSLPAYQRLHEDFQSPDWALIAINVDANEEDGIEFLADAKVTYPVIADQQGNIGIPYNVRSLPVSYLINQRGEIVARYRGFEPGDELEIWQAIQDLMGK
jgi:thiol-disulfide isomerase/thioredoxin